MNPQLTKVGFIGTGVMGGSMASHVQQGGYEVHIYTRTKEKALPLIEQGLIWQDTPGNLARVCDVIITMVGYPSDVEELYLGPSGLIDSARSGTTFIDMTTSSPALARRIYDAAKARGMYALDAPVSGGDIGARNAALTIMAGGDREDYERVLPILSRMGKQILLQGAAGAGQHTKMANQIAIASTMIGVCEALIYAKNAGLELDQVLQSISAGSAGSWSLSNLAPRMVAGNFEPGFYVKHFIKDMGIALDSAAEMQIELPGLALARELYQRIADAGLGDKGTHALYKAWDE
ncbi:NAD(P)-dependent oxidoreductase [Paenibacillus sp. 1011MAR3C5]|uniref:NAD(P)-dependent oxidoreductase n=1 Tax=Paenibacillus sp. 1011MAR3C5 TaxID=1675787 RepID=UPI000E6CBC7A|nr:NAD(P)-dependent oxidoreductase [Paenibacillus sp. 1011MAR3C5]RJE86845.1 NAD(P)-dependent oxidoreductase [Paenibacillus sp. 1011MAR3C5]